MTVRKELESIARVGLAIAAVGTACALPGEEAQPAATRTARPPVTTTLGATPTPDILAMVGPMATAQARQVQELQAKVAQLQAEQDSLAKQLAAQLSGETKGNLRIQRIVNGDEDEWYLEKGDKPFGNREAWTIIQFYDGKNTNSVIHALVEPDYALRVLANSSPTGSWQGAEWHAWGVDINKEQAKEELANMMYRMKDEAMKRDVLPDIGLLYVGAGEAPAGFWKELPDKWCAQEFLKGEQCLEGKWAETKLNAQGSLLLQASDKIRVAQTWDGVNVASTRQYVVEPGTPVFLAGNQIGSLWTVEGGGMPGVARRVKEMEKEWKTYDSRRGNRDLQTVYCGQGQAPAGLISNRDLCRPQ